MTATFTMNSYLGKQLLALVRDGDYAHAGEEEAIEIAMAPMRRDSDRRLLDAGCGRGGTAAYLQKHGWGQVTGVDVEAQSIERARSAHPGVCFEAADIADLSGRFDTGFDAVAMFNVLYAITDHHAALSSLAATARDGASLTVFDYADPGDYSDHAIREGDKPFLPNPIAVADIEPCLAAAGWEVTGVDRIDADYVRWYEALVTRIDRKRADMEALAGPEGFARVRGLYAGLRDVLRQGHLAGAVIRAERVA